MSDKDRCIEFDEPPGCCSPGQEIPYAWRQVPGDKWQDWRWQMAHRLRSVEDFSRIIDLTPQERAGLVAPDRFRVDVTPYFASLMDPHDPNCPVRRQVIPTDLELVPFDAEMVDSLGEDAHSPVPGLVHRYPDRVLMLVTAQCASYCRFCTRSRLVGTVSSSHRSDGNNGASQEKALAPGGNVWHGVFNSATYKRQLDYIAKTPSVRDVLLSGGDPLTLSLRVLERLLRDLHSIPHVEVIRIGSRMPIFLPQRITDDLVAVLAKYHPVWMNIHVNHPKEITPEVEVALSRLANAGIPLGSQTVLLAGVNDCPNVMVALVHSLVRNRVRPYYLYQCDLVHGAGHFRTPVAKGIEIMEALRGHTSGFAVPTYVIDAPEGGGKVPILPNYLISMSDTKVVVRNYEGFITTYAQPVTYRGHDPTTCSYCRQREQLDSQDGGQGGLADLLAGDARAIMPEGWRDAHQRLVYRRSTAPFIIRRGARDLQRIAKEV